MSRRGQWRGGWRGAGRAGGTAGQMENLQVAWKAFETADRSAAKKVIWKVA